MKGLKILVVVAALALITVAVSDAWAGCSPARLFRSQGKPNNTNNVLFSVEGVDPGANEIGRLWDSDDANNSNSGLEGPDFGSLCPPSVWWLDQGGNKKIDGFHGGTGCAASGCPEDNMTVVVEDYGSSGPPGVNGTAYYVGAMVYETPASDRWWDYGLVDGVTSNTTFPMAEFPQVVIVGSTRNQATIIVNYNNLDQGNNVHTWDVPSGQPFPTAAVVAQWQLVKATGNADPGRLRSNGWVTIQTTEYIPGGAPANFDVPCASTATDEYLAIGIGFNGGAFGVIDSALVGKAIQLECDPNVADPDLPFADSPKSSGTEFNSRPGRTGGRR